MLILQDNFASVRKYNHVKNSKEAYRLYIYANFIQAV